MNLIVFDIDDTLTKSEYQHQLAYVNAMKAFGITEINQNWRDYKHHTDSFILKENYEQNLKDAFDFSFVERFEAKMTELILTMQAVTAIKGACAAVESFSANPNYAVAFATGSFLKPAFVKLNQAGIQYDSDLVVGSNTIFSREGIVEQAMEKAKVFYQVDAFDNVIAVGDGIWDLKAASNLGLHFVGIGTKNYSDFKKEHVKLHIEDWSAFDLAEAEAIFGL